MKIIIGLGNPGEKYEATWHNIGFMALDEYAKENNFPEFKLSKKFDALVSEKDKVILLKPQTFMNHSGKSLRLASSFYKIPFKDVIVIHDEADVLAGKIKVSEGRGSAGHKGVESIFEETKSQEFLRIRIGIGIESVKKEAKDIVLDGINKGLAKKGIKKAIEALDVMLSKGVEKAMNEFNQ